VEIAGLFSMNFTIPHVTLCTVISLHYQRLMNYSVLLFTHKNCPEAGVSNMWPSGLWDVA